MTASLKGKERTYGLWFGIEPDGVRNISAPNRPPDNMLGDTPLGELEVLDARPSLPNRLLNWYRPLPREHS